MAEKDVPPVAKRSVGRRIGIAWTDFVHWAVFSFLLSLAPFVLLIDTTAGHVWVSFTKQLSDAAVVGNLTFTLIPILGGLLGETVIRRFYSDWFERVAFLAGILLMFFAMSQVVDLSGKDVTTFADEELDTIVSQTRTLWLITILYAATLIAVTGRQSLESE